MAHVDPSGQVGMSPKMFIDGVLITEIGDIIPQHPYHAFVLIGIGIEFLGRALDSTKPWNHRYGRADTPPFDKAICELFPERYHDKELRDPLRNGLAHFYAPKVGLGLSRLSDPGIEGIISYENHPYLSGGMVILVIEYLYRAFVDACREVIGMEFSPQDKMSMDFLSVPDRG